MGNGLAPWVSIIVEILRALVYRWLTIHRQWRWVSHHVLKTPQFRKEAKIMVLFE